LGCLSTGRHRALGPSDKHGRCFCSQANSGSYVPCPHTFGFITRDLQLITMAGATTHKHEDGTRKVCITPHWMPQYRLSNCCSNKRGAWFDVFLYLDLRQAESLVFCQMVVLPRCETKSQQILLASSAISFSTFSSSWSARPETPPWNWSGEDVHTK
jgi:hypothetical protein